MENVVVTIDKDYYDQVDEYLRKTLGWDQYNEQDHFDYVDFTFSDRDYKKVRKFLNQFDPDVMYEITKELKVGSIILEAGDKIQILEAGPLRKACGDFIRATDNILKMNSPADVYGDFMVRQLIQTWESFLRDTDGFIDGIEEAIKSFK